MNNDKNYYVSHISKPWQNSLTFCMRYNMDLVTFDSKIESDYFLNLIDDDVYWIGITDVFVDGIFRNYNDLEKISSSFLTWVAGAPASVLGTEDCVWMEKTGANDITCSTYANIACERRIPKKPATKVLTAIAPEPPSEKFDFAFKSGK